MARNQTMHIPEPPTSKRIVTRKRLDFVINCSYQYFVNGKAACPQTIATVLKSWDEHVLSLDEHIVVDSDLINLPTLKTFTNSGERGNLFRWYDFKVDDFTMMSLELYLTMNGLRDFGVVNIVSAGSLEAPSWADAADFFCESGKKILA